MSNSDNSAGHSLRVMMLDSTGAHAEWSSDVTAFKYGWDFVRVDSVDQIMQKLSRDGCDVFVVSCSFMRPQQCIDLMNQVAVSQPSAIRVLLGTEFWNAHQRAKSVEVSHRQYAHDSKVGELKGTVEYLCKLTRLLGRNSLQSFINNVGCLPTPPKVYAELTDAINSDVSDALEIAKIVERDPAVVAQVMKQVNSSYFGFERNISNLHEAVTLLGLRNLRSMALSSQLNSQFKQDKDWQQFSFEAVNERSLLVARLAQVISRRSGASKAQQDHAFLAGLLHELGVLIMASHNPEQYKKLLAYSVKKQKPIYLVEKASFGFFHGEVGAALLGLWNLPPQVVEAVMLHHVPHLSEDQEFSPLTAVHVADAMLPSVSVVGNCDMASTLSLRYLDQIGVMDDVPQWRIIANEYRLKMVSNA